MTGQFLRLTRWEWFKLRHRWMPWILLAVLLLLTQLVIWGVFLSFKNTQSDLIIAWTYSPDSSPTAEDVPFECKDLLEGRGPDVSQLQRTEEMGRHLLERCQERIDARREQLSELYTLITPPGSASFTMSIGQGIGLILVAILIASLIGTEHGWGTMRFLLVRGVRRWHVLASKLGIAWLAFAAALLIIGVLGTLSGQIIDGLLSGAEGLENSSSWGEVSELFGRSLLSVLPYVAIVSLVTVAARSSAAGIGIGVGYYFLEQTVVGIFGSLFDWFQNVAEFLPIFNMEAFVGAGGGVTVFEVESPDYAGDLQTLLVMAAYALVAGALAFYLLHRRDIGGASRG